MRNYIMRLELVLELEKNELPLDNKSIWIHFIKDVMSNVNDKKYYDRFFSTKAQNYTFSVILNKPEFINKPKLKKIRLSSNTVKMIFSSDDRNITGWIFYTAFLERKGTSVSFDKGKNSMKLISVFRKKEPEIKETCAIFMTVTGGGMLIRKHNRETNKDYYVTERDDDFIEETEKILRNQADIAGFSETTAKTLKFIPLEMKSVPVLQYKTWTYVNMGTFALEGDPELLQYFYKAGVGSKRSMGYGMVELLI